MFYTFIVIVHIGVCAFLILTVLLQAGKGGGMGALGGGGSATVFGGRGASTFLSKLTSASAATFMVLAIVLARMSLDTSAIDVDKANVTETVGEGAEGAEGAAPAEGAPTEGAPAEAPAPTPKEAAPTPAPTEAAPTPAPTEAAPTPPSE